MTPHENTPKKSDTMKYLLYAAIALLLLNFILIFLPFMEIYQPSYSKTVLGQTTYEDWYTRSAPMALFIVPIFLPGIPYVCAMARLKSKKSPFNKLKTQAFTKKQRFGWLKLGSIFNLFMMIMMWNTAQDTVRPYEEVGAYCRMTIFGVLNFICTLAFIIVLFMLSRKSKAMIPVIANQQGEIK